MNRSLKWILLLTLTGSTCWADSPEAEVASRAWAVTDAVLARHLDPPTRQQMILAGIKAVVGDEAKPSISRLALRVSNLADSEQLAKLLAEVWVKSKLTDDEKREDVFFEGLLSVVPGNAHLLSGQERKVTESMEANLYVGIQVAVSEDEQTKKLLFQKIFDGGPGDLAGIKAGDLIEEVDGVSVEGMPLAKVIQRLRGAEGTEVLLKYSRPSTKEVFARSLTRNRLPRETIEGLSRRPDRRWNVRLDEGSPIGYLKVKEIMGSTPRELRAFAEQLEAEGAKALVLDVREVQSAGVHPTVLLADALLDGGVIGRIASSEGERIIQAEPDALFRGWPIVVLTNEVSIGGVAWFASALEANKRATIVGGNLVAKDSAIREMVALSGSEWSIQMPTGRLERGDGQPLASVKPRSVKPGSIDETRQKALEDAMATIDRLRLENNDWTSNLAMRLQQFTVQLENPTIRQQPTPEQGLKKARAILEEALKSASPR
jgi:carboxyl-terminal processing protease